MLVRLDAATLARIREGAAKLGMSEDAYIGYCVQTATEAFKAEGLLPEAEAEDPEAAK